jgi:lysozyme
MSNQTKSKVGLTAIASVLTLAVAAPFVAKWEGLETKTYRDVVGIPTVCYGDTGPHVQMGMQFTAEECKAMLDQRLLEYAQRLDACIAKPLTPYQGAAVLELGYNVGTSAVCRSTMARMIREGKPASEWCAQLKRWVMAGGRRYQGLVNRREDSYQMCIKE